MKLAPLKIEIVNGHTVGLFPDGFLRVYTKTVVKVGPDDYEFGHKWYKGTTRERSAIIRASNLYTESCQ